MTAAMDEQAGYFVFLSSFFLRTQEVLFDIGAAAGTALDNIFLFKNI